MALGATLNGRSVPGVVGAVPKHSKPPTARRRCLI
jgi:hypothetical protein